MNTLVFAMVLFSALSHAVWNFFTKKAARSLAMMWSGLLAVNLVLLPVSVWLIARDGLETAAWPFMIGSGLAHALYFTTLMRSYNKTDISTAYPISRGVGVAGTALLAVGLLNEAVSPRGAAGIALICAGVLLIGLRMSGLKAGLHGIGWPLLVGLCTVSYSIVDKVGVAHAHPIVYINVGTLVACVILGPFLFARHRANIVALCAENWKMGLLIGVGVMGTYLLILFAFRQAQASYIAAVREFSIVVGALMGVLFLGEKLTLGKVLGIASIAAGLIFVRLA